MVVIKMNILAYCSISCVFYNIVQSASLSKMETKVDYREHDSKALKKGHQVLPRSYSKGNIITEPTENENAYGIRLNGDTQKAPPWPQEDEKNMFLLPKIMQFNERVRITGQMSGREGITASLLTELDSEIPCQVEVSLADDKINLQAISNNTYYPVTVKEKPSALMDESSFDFTFVPRIIGGSQFIEFELSKEVIGKVQLMHELKSIRYLSVKGDVAKFNILEYEFA